MGLCVKLKENLENDNLEIRIVLSEKCNLNCKYCFLKTKSEKVLDYSKLYDFIKSLNFKYLILTFSGGEPLLLIDKIIEICEKIKPNYVNILTNGTLIKKEYKNLKKLSLLFETQLIISHHIDFKFDILKYLKSLNIDYYFRKPILLKKDTDFENTDYFPCYDNVNELELLPKDKFFLINNKEKTLKELYDISEFNFKGMFCESGKNLIIIDYNGDIYPCSEYYRKHFKPETFETFKQKETICEMDKCWCFTCKRYIKTF